jgi:hypothetical protein
MKQIEDQLADFEAISLDGLNTIKLMNRYDRKFVFRKDKLPAVLDYLRKDYRVLEIDGKRVFQYENLYYDTGDHFFYCQHHNRRPNRYKVRCRRYVETDQCYFEIKFKNRKSKTIKTRMLLGDGEIDEELSEASREFARRTIMLNGSGIADRIRPSLWTNFNRITFGNLINGERLTIDLNLTYADHAAHSRTLDDLIIAELKSEGRSRNCLFTQHLRDLRILSARFSKYCMGIAMTERDVKRNRFKRQLLRLNKII